MCNVGKAVGDFLNPGANEAGKQADKYSGMSAAQYDRLIKMGEEQFGLAKEEYNKQTGIRDQMTQEAELTPERLALARSRSGSDIEREFQRQEEERQRSIAAAGGNPADPGFSGGPSASVSKALAKASGGTQAELNEWNKRMGLSASVTGRQIPSMTSGTQAVGAGASGYGNLAATAQNDPRQGLFGIPGLSLRHGGSVGRNLIRAPAGGMVAPGAMPQGRGLVQDPPQYGAAKDIPLIKGPDGSFASPSDPGPSMGGHITGPGKETEDKVPAALSPDEYVVPAFGSKTFGTPAFDAISEVARKTQTGDPVARQDAMKLLRVVSSFKSTQQGGAPQRVAGETPNAGAPPPQAVPSPMPMPPPPPMVIRRHPRGIVHADAGGIANTISDMSAPSPGIQPTAPAQTAAATYRLGRLNDRVNRMKQLQAGRLATQQALHPKPEAKPEAKPEPVDNTSGFGTFDEINDQVDPNPYDLPSAQGGGAQGGAVRIGRGLVRAFGGGKTPDESWIDSETAGDQAPIPQAGRPAAKSEIPWWGRLDTGSGGTRPGQTNIRRGAAKIAAAIYAPGLFSASGGAVHRPRNLIRQIGA